MARKVNPLSILGALDKFVSAIPEGFTISGLYTYSNTVSVSMTGSVDAVRAAFPAARLTPTYDVGVMQVEGEAQIFDGERRLSLCATARSEVPTVERWLAPEGDEVDVWGFGVWNAETKRRTSAVSGAVRCIIAVSDLPALRALSGLVVSETMAEALAA